MDIEKVRATGSAIIDMMSERGLSIKEMMFTAAMLQQAIHAGVSMVKTLEAKAN